MQAVTVWRTRIPGLCCRRTSALAGTGTTGTGWTASGIAFGYAVHPGEGAPSVRGDRTEGQSGTGTGFHFGCPRLPPWPVHLPPWTWPIIIPPVPSARGEHKSPLYLLPPLAAFYLVWAFIPPWFSLAARRAAAGAVSIISLPCSKVLYEAPGREVLRMICPECGVALRPDGGCWVCLGCGWSACEVARR